MDINNYLVLNEERNAMDFLIQSLIFLVQVEQNRFYLKWFIIAFHGALYSFMLLVIKNVDSLQIYKEEKKKQSNNKNRDSNEGHDPFKGKLIEFMKSYEVVKKISSVNGSTVLISENLDVCMKELNYKLRNQMIHFKPMTWGSEPDYPASVCYPLLDVLRFCLNFEKIGLDQSEKYTAISYVDSIDRLLIKHIS